MEVHANKEESQVLQTEMPGMKGLRRASCLRFGIVGTADYHMVQPLSMWVGRAGVITMHQNMEFWTGGAKWQKSYFAWQSMSLSPRGQYTLSFC